MNQNRKDKAHGDKAPFPGGYAAGAWFPAPTWPHLLSWQGKALVFGVVCCPLHPRTGPRRVLFKRGLMILREIHHLELLTFQQRMDMYGS